MSKLCKQINGCEHYCNQRCLEVPTADPLKELENLCKMLDIVLEISYSCDNVDNSRKWFGYLSTEVWLSEEVMAETYTEVLQKLFKTLKENYET